MNLPRLAVFAIVAMLAARAVWGQPAPPPPPLPPEDAADAQAAVPYSGDADLEPQVTVIRRDTETVEEVRIGGELKFIRVTPVHGKPYYLVPDTGTGTMIRRNSLDPSVRVPMWVLFSW